MHRHHLDPVNGGSALDVIRRLCGVQAQVPSAAAQAVALRQQRPEPNATTQALNDRSLIRTWAMRGTLHLLPSDVAPAFLSLLAAARTWEKGSWQRAFLTVTQLDRLTVAVETALEPGVPLTREELVERAIDATGDESLGQHVKSGWGAVLKPLAWRGLICHGPSDGNRVSFVRPDRWFPDWTGIPDPEDAARVVVPAYLAAYGPATPTALDQWLLRGATPKATLRRWFADLGDAVTPVDVEGTEAFVRSEDLAKLASIRPTGAVRLLPAFDQYVLGPGTGDPHLVPQAHRSSVSRAGGWIAPVVISRGRVVGTWATNDDRLRVDLMPGEEPPARAALDAEAARLRAVLDTDVTLDVISS